MGWHMEGTPSWTMIEADEEGKPQYPMPWQFDLAPCGRCHGRITPDEAFVFWSGVEIIQLELGKKGGEEHYGELFLHPQCAFDLAHSLIKDSMMADKQGTHPGAGRLGGKSDD